MGGPESILPLFYSCFDRVGINADRMNGAPGTQIAMGHEYLRRVQECVALSGGRKRDGVQQCLDGGPNPIILPHCE